MDYNTYLTGMLQTPRSIETVQESLLQAEEKCAEAIALFEQLKKWQLGRTSHEKKDQLENQHEVVKLAEEQVLKWKAAVAEIGE